MLREGKEVLQPLQMKLGVVVDDAIEDVVDDAVDVAVDGAVLEDIVVARGRQTIPSL